MLGDIIFYKKDYFRYFSIVFLLYSVSISVSSVFGLPILFYRLSTSLLSLLSLFIIIKNLDTTDASPIVYWLFALTLSWYGIIVLRGLSLDPRILARLFVSPTFFLPFVAIVFLYINKDISFIRVLFKIIVVYDIFFICLVLFGARAVFDDVNNYEAISKQLAFPNCFLLLCYAYQKRRIKIWTLFIFLVCFITVLFLARRNQIFTLGLFAFMALMLHIFYFYRRYIIRNALIIFLVVVVLVGGYQKYASDLFSTFSLLVERIDANTRQVVEDCLYEDMKPLDYVIGKGMAAKYYCPSIDYNEGESDKRTEEEKDYRMDIETGYLNIILKGGIISLMLFALFCLSAIVKGLFFSKNGFVKACALLVLVNMLGISIESNQAFSLRYLLVWICIGCCFSKRINSYSDAEIEFEIKGDNLLKYGKL
ncbi:hypothetical protein [Filimonas effusa]|uniref:O-antigen ligase domain-containing protein n=1 Tax=Filimonas effusa TaxID=2508721 RepID=A0A4Q1D1U6_9BACT|nr:hypothetical protein [Filimonas effusa]RXK81846.1 hypothetical protein ESB13_18835 [Filimonas effusa]